MHIRRLLPCRRGALKAVVSAALVLARKASVGAAYRVAAASMSSANAQARSALQEMGTKGEFQRTPSVFRDHISPDSKYKPASGRYHLYVSYACPWAHRTLIVRALKGLEDAIGVSVVHPTWQRTRPNDPSDKHNGWVFRKSEDPPITPVSGHGAIECDGCIPDMINGAVSIRDLYDKAGDQGGKYSVPVLWDKETGCIVNNESAEICEMFDREFNEFASNPGLDLFPKGSEKDQAEVNEWIYNDINNGVYKCGFAQSQEAYDDAVHKLFASLDRAEDILSRQRYLCGNELTLADIRFYVTLVRFDEVYTCYFKTNKARIADYPNLHNYLREIFQTGDIGKTTNMTHIKRHYYTSHPVLNAFSVIPAGMDVLSDLSKPHDRDRFENP